MATKKPTKKPAAKKPAAKKTAAKKPATKKTAAKKPAPKKPVAKKPAPKKAVAKKSAPKKPIAKKPVAKAKPAPKAAAVKKPIAKAPAVKAKPAPKAVAPAKKPAPVVAETKKAAPAPVVKVEPKKPEVAKVPEKPVAKTPEGPKKKVERKITYTPTGEATVNINKNISIPVYSKPKQNVMIDKNKKPAEVDTRTRYSDAELQEFKEIILKKLDEAKRDLELLRGSLSHTDDHGTDDTSPTFKMMEDGSETLSREETAQLAGRQEKFIIALESALIRVENKTYGLCRVTGKLIDKNRLRLVPHTTLSIEAKNLQN